MILIVCRLIVYTQISFNQVVLTGGVRGIDRKAVREEDKTVSRDAEIIPRRIST